VADDIFEEPQLASIYDLLEPERPDLLPSVAMAEEFGARRVLDIEWILGDAAMTARRGWTWLSISVGSRAQSWRDLARGL
jgi:hypothetical protein